MKLNIIDKENWVRKEHFDFYMKQIVMSYAVSADIEIGGFSNVIKREGLSFYPVMCWAVTKLINENQLFRLSLVDSSDVNAGVGYYDYLSPSYPILHNDTESISVLCTEWNGDLRTFHDAHKKDTEKFKDDKSLHPRPLPPNILNVTSLPWLSFNGVSYQVKNGHNYLRPVIAWGKIYEKEGRLIMPVSFQIHHAAADGYHTARFFKQLEELCNNIDRYL